MGFRPTSSIEVAESAVYTGTTERRHRADWPAWRRRTRCPRLVRLEDLNLRPEPSDLKFYKLSVNTQVHRPFNVVASLTISTQKGVDDHSIVESPGIQRVQTYGFVEVSDGLNIVTQSPVGDASIIERIRTPRGKSYSLTVFSRVPGSGVRGRGSGERETTASSLAGKEESSRKEDNSGQGKDGPAGAIAQGGNGR